MSSCKYNCDTKLKRLLEALEESKKRHRVEKFNEWLKKIIYHEVNSDFKMNISDIIENLFYETKELINYYGHTISDEKRLRDSIASMIYKESENGPK